MNEEQNPLMSLLEQAESAEQRYLQHNDVSGLDEAIHYWQQILQSPNFPAQDEYFQLSILNNIAVTYWYRYKARGVIQDSDTALQAWQALVKKLPDDSPYLPSILNNLDTGLRDRHSRLGNLGDLQAGISAFQQAIDHSPPDFPDLATMFNNLGNRLTNRYSRSGDLDDLQAGISAYEKAIAHTPPDSPDLASLLNNLGRGLRHRYLRLGGLDDLQAGISAFQQAIAHIPPDSTGLAKCLNNLGLGLTDRYLRLGNLGDLQAGIAAHEKAIAHTPPDSPESATILNNLGGGLRHRYLRLGDLDDLQAGIAAHEKAIAHTPPDSPELVKCLNNLGLGVTDRYLRLGDLGDLQAGISAFQQAIDRTPPDSPELAKCLNNLGLGVTNRYLRLGDLGDLQAGISAFQQAIDHTPPDSPELAGRLNNLGSGLTDRYLRLGGLGDLQAAIAAYEKAITYTPPDSPDLATILNNLGTGLRGRYLRLGDLGDLQAAIAAYEKAIAHTPPDSPDLAGWFNNLGNGLSDRYSRLGDDLGDLQAGIKAYQRAIELDKKGSLENLLNHSVNLLNWAFERSNWQEMEEVYPQIQATSEQLVEKQLQREHQEAFLTETQGISAAMAYARIQLHNPAGAVEALEQGAARLLSTALARDNADISQLQQDYPDLYARYEQQRKAVKNAQRFYQNANEEQHKAAFEQWQQQEAHFQSVLSEIRQQPDQENFLNIATDINRVYQAADTRPLVYVFYTDKGGYALRIFKKEIQAIVLPDLTTEKWQERFDKYFNAYDNAHNNQKEWQQAIDDLTAWLYTAIMQPIVSHLPSTEFTLIPIGYLNLFPLHLAWTKENGTRHYMVDKFTINYAPNALALVNAQKSAILPSDNLLLINEPKPVEASELPSSIMESIAIKQHFKQHTEFAHEQATVSAVKEALNNSPNVLHFACHGEVDFENPLKTGLLMANYKMLTVADFFQAQLQARLVSLSACQTGIIGTKKVEEVVGLPTSLLHAGAAGILASLWPVKDVSTALLMMHFYHNFMQKKQAPQAALREAQLWLREANNQEIYDWLKKPVLSQLGSSYRLRFHQNANNKPLEKPYQSAYYWGAFYYTGI
ncbi:CHAT domain-containing protein [Thioflexithrix psekupsensis]|uniref:CHAT domain-containing protein n=1 Tax=Thioflexithrix psekupsensis TaxID=1570016 RepID=A0A251X8U4_9GAMM|nr:CHAT domain-containing tetratricopeptide repeat protein [Thioflexithrix psekupsensis]OUD14204.1 hypothetical protein TPSD3_07690 [Thioflexithrix psekupsensis]